MCVDERRLMRTEADTDRARRAARVFPTSLSNSSQEQPHGGGFYKDPGNYLEV